MDDKNCVMPIPSHLYGRPARLEYLPTETSRKWRRASVEWVGLSHDAYLYALDLAKQEGWWNIRFVPLDDCLKITVGTMRQLEAKGLIKFECPSGRPSESVEVAYSSTASRQYYAIYQGKRWRVIYDYYDHHRYRLEEVSDGRD